MISFIMPARNVSSYVSEAVNGLLKAKYEDWELIIIEDHSTDDTLSILREIEKRDCRIRVFENKGVGQVVGLNYGYTFSSGAFIKCIDADDVLDTKFFHHVDIMNNYDALCHDSYVTSSKLRVIGNYSVDKSILIKDFSYCLKCLKSPPRWTWSFTRSIGDRIFPIPEDLPFEDVWFSLMIKKYAKRICYVNDKLYYYRQHDKQLFGGILNFNSEVVSFRANRMLKVIDVIKEEKTKRLISGIEAQNFFEDIETFYRLLAREKLRLWDIMTPALPMRLKLKLLVYRKFKFVAPSLVKIKWLLNRTL